MWALFFGGIDERYYKINQIYGYFIYEKANRLEGLKFNDAYVELSDIMTKEEFQTLFDNMVRAGLIVSDKGPVLKEEKKAY